VTRHLASLAALAGLAFASACDFGSDPLGVDLPRPVPIAIEPVFALIPTKAELALLDHLRVTLRSAEDSSVVRTETVAIDPTDDEWQIELTVEVRPGQGGGRNLYLETELIDADGATESVEWSGRTRPFLLQAADRPLEFRQVDLYRGPLANLGLTDVTFTRGSLRLVEGSTSSIGWLTQGDTAGTVVYLAVRDESIATVDAFGHLETRGVGTTSVFVYGGMVEDSLELEVTQIYLPPQTEIVASIKPQLDYVTSDLFLATFHDPASAEMLRAPIVDLSAHLEARDGPAVVADFEAIKTAYDSYGSDSVSPNRYEDGPQLGVLQLTLHRVATALRTAFP